MALVAVEHLTFRYPESAREALRDISFSLSAGEFAVLCGPSGCGKSTLLRQLKRAFTPHGEREGEVRWDGRPLSAVDERTQSREIGFVGQSPDNQLVTDKVWHELAFGLESLGMDTPAIRSRVAETASFFGIQTWFDAEVAALSGGQKQLLNLAAVMVTEPKLLLLDEPTAQLDPIAAAEFLAAVGRVNRELGTTVLVVEHRLEDLLPYSDRLLVMEDGRLAADGTPDAVARLLREQGSAMFAAMPTPVRVWAAVPESGEYCPWSVGEGRVWLNGYTVSHPPRPLPEETIPPCGDTPMLEIENVWFRYEKNAPDVLKGASLCVRSGELLTLLGGNGIGKSTLLSLVTGAHRPYRGHVRVNGQPLEQIPALFDGLLGVLPQSPQALFTRKTVREDLTEVFDHLSLPKEEQQARVDAMLRLCGLEGVAQRHPYDLSGGEQQRAALAKVLLLRPRLLLLDEPTKGMDAAFKQRFAAILRRLLQQGTAIVMVSHDVEFCARFAHRCALLFNGAVVAENTPRAFFSRNSFYTTAACRMAKHTIPDAVTAEDVIAACGGTLPPTETLPPDETPPPPKQDESPPPARTTGWWRRLTAGMGVLLCGAAAWLQTGKAVPAPLNSVWVTYGLLGLALICFVLAFGRGTRRFSGGETRVPRQKPSRRTYCAVGMILLAIPLTLFVGVTYLGDQKYLFISLLVLLEGMLPFFLMFESRRPQARELVLIAVLCALGVAGRSAMYILPQFKPVAALTIIAGAAFGGETGFLVGSLTMLTSNILFQQGPWTPWQMFAMGMIGFLAGMLYQSGLLRRSRLSLMAFGFFTTLLLYGGLMNLASAVMARAALNLPTLLAYEAAGLPMDMIHALATVVFLFFLAEPMLEKLERVKQKYGLI